MRFPVVHLPRWPVGGVSADTLLGDIAAWVDSSAMLALVRAFGGSPPSGDVPTRLARLDDFSTIWDARRGGERMDTRHADHDQPIRELVEAAAPALGLAGRQQPATDRYDHVLVLGGRPISGRVRARYAADLLKDGISTDTVAGLGSLRVLPPSAVDGERTGTGMGAGMGAGDSAGGPDGDDGGGADGSGCGRVHTEGDAMLAAMWEAFPATGKIMRHSGVNAAGHTWWVKTYPSAGRPVSVVAAPPTRPGQRANTADTLLGWAGLVAQPAATDHVLVVTTDLYVPFQHAEVINTIGLTYRCGIDTVGFDVRSYPAWPEGPSHTGQLLQELRSAIRSMRTLAEHALRVRP